MSDRKFGIGFIGAGEISILHAIALREIPNAKLIGLWNRTTETAVRRAKAEAGKVRATGGSGADGEIRLARYACGARSRKAAAISLRVSLSIAGRSRRQRANDSAAVASSAS